jgi:hypothetical protein
LLSPFHLAAIKIIIIPEKFHAKMPPQFSRRNYDTRDALSIIVVIDFGGAMAEHL